MVIDQISGHLYYVNTNEYRLDGYEVKLRSTIDIIDVQTMQRKLITIEDGHITGLYIDENKR